MGANGSLDLGLPLWLGGVPSSLSDTGHVTSHGITACVRNVFINGELLDLETHILERNSQRGCSQLEPEVCVTNTSTCGSGSSCIAQWESFSCRCAQRREGESCQSGKPCLNLYSCEVYTHNGSRYRIAGIFC